MDKPVRLAFVPGYPVSLESLCPKSHLLLLQNKLASKGIAADIVDFGVFENRSVVEPGDADNPGDHISGWVEQIARGWGGFPSWFGATADATLREKELINAARRNRLEKGSPQVLVFWLESRDQLPAILALSTGLRSSQPRMQQVLSGPYAFHYGACLLGSHPGVDVVVPEDVAGALASYLQMGEWSSVPGVIRRAAQGQVQRLERNRSVDGHIPLNVSCLSRLQRVKQFPLYHVDFREFPAAFYYQDHAGMRVSKKHAGTLVDEIIFLQRRHNASVFHISAAHVSPAELLDLTNTLLVHNIVIIYSLGDITEPIGSSLAQRLFASGCRSVGFRAPAGSQRVLEDFYGCTTGASAMVASVCNCNAAGIFTAVRMCYPCPVDDYHTRAETELFLDTAKPASVCIESPALSPESVWFRQSSAYGFFVSHKEYHRYVAGGNAAYGDLPYTMRGWSAKRVQQARTSLERFAVAAGCMIDVTEQSGVLARLMRSVMDEAEFLEELRNALEQHRPERLESLLSYVCENARTLSESTQAARELVGTVAFSS